MKCSTLKASFFAIFFFVPFMAMAQSQNPPAAANQQSLRSEELDALVAPIALYPDTLLAEVLMASTYPLEWCRPTVGQPRTRPSRAIN